MRCWTKVGRLFLLLSLLPLGAVEAASEVTGRISGYVYDPTGQPLAEVPVAVRGPTVPLAQTATGDDGRYEFSLLPPAEAYTLEVNIPGFNPVLQRDLKVRAGQTTPVDIRLSVLVESQPSATYSIVEKVSPVLNPDSAQAATVFEAEQLTRAAVAHNSNALPSLLPGVGPGASPSVRGGLTRYSKMFVDGIETDDIVTQGLAVPLHFDSVENYEVIAGSMDAQYNSLGLIENVVTKSGSNKFIYDVILNVAPSWLSAAAKFSPGSPSAFGDYYAFNQPTPSNSSYLPVVSLGGPIIKDKLWFFTTWDYVYQDRENPVLLPNQPLVYRPTLTHTVTGHVKLTWQATARDRVSITFNPERNSVQNNVGNSTVTSQAEQRVLRTEGWLLANYDHQVSGNVLFQLQTGATYKTGDFDPIDLSNMQISHTDQNANVTDFNAGRVNSTQPGNFLHETKWRYSLDPTLSWKFKGGGSHEMKAGAQFLYMYDRQIAGVIGNQRYFDRGGVCNPSDPSTFAFCNQRVDFYNSQGQQGSLTTTASAVTLGTFIQDRWHVSRQLTLTPGFRLDLGKLRNDSGNTITNLVGYGPRLGAVFDLFANRKTLFLASYGRSNDIGNGNVFVAQHGNPVLVQVTSTFNRTTNQFPACTPNSGLAGCATQGGPLGNVFDPHPTAPHVDELSAGLHHQVIPDLVLGTDYTYRYYGNLWADAEVNRIWDSTGTQIIGYADGVAHSIVQSVTPSSAYRRYHGLDLWAQGNPGRWDLLASYTLAFNTGTVTDYFDGFLNNPRFAAFADGNLPDDFRHTLRGLVGYRTSVGLDFSFRLQYRTGRPLWENFPNPADPSQRAYRSPRGTAFATNPQTGGPDFNDPRSWVDFRTPSLLQVDAEARYNIGQLFHMKDRLEIAALVINVLNDTSATVLQDAYNAGGRNFGVATAHNNPIQATLILRWRNTGL
jgi:hypothetical protein